MGLGWGQVYLLQARPITSLYPVPAGMPESPLQVMFALAAVQGVFEPFTPLGQDSLTLILSGARACLWTEPRFWATDHLFERGRSPVYQRHAGPAQPHRTQDSAAVYPCDRSGRGAGV